MREQDALGRLLDEDAPPATAAGLAGVVARRDRLARRRLQVVSACSVALAVAMVGVVIAGAARPSPRPAAVARPAGAAPQGPPKASAPTASTASPSTPRASGLAPGGRASAAGAGGGLALAVLGRSAGVSVRGFVRPLAASAAGRPSTAAGAAAGSCRRVEALVVEVADRRAVGRLVLEAPAPRAASFAAGALAVIGRREGEPVEVAAARVPSAARSVQVRFGDAPREAALVHEGWAVAVVRLAAHGAPVQATLVARDARGVVVATLELAAHARAWLPPGCGPGTGAVRGP